jgi:branched-chain amino acid transport system substrate-binding protein
MRKRYILAGLLVLLLVVAVVAAACGGTETTTTAAAPSTTAAPSTETTAVPSSETTAPPSSETTAAPSTETTTAGPATGEPIKIGLINSLTGFSAAPGISVDKGVRLEIEYVNQNGGINGRPLELVEYDDKSDVPTALANLNKLLQQDKVVATIGPFAQYEQEPARKIAEQAKVPMVGDGPATLEQLDAKPQYQWSVMTAAGPRVQGASVAKVVTAHGWKNILGLADVLTIDQETLDVLGQLAPDAGFKFTKMPDSFGFDQQDFQPILNKMMDQINTLKPDSIILYVNPIAFPPLYKGLRGLGVTLPILAGTACAHPAIFALGPQAVDGAYVMDSGGNVNPSALPDSWPIKQLQLDFAQRYQAKYKEAPDFFAAAGADMVTALAAGMKQAGGPDQAKVAQALINLKEVPSLEGMLTWTPDATSEGIHGYMVEWQVKNAQWVLVNTIQQP